MIMDDNILIKYLDNQLPEGEKKAVETWLSISPDNRKLLEDIYFTLELTKRFHVMNSVDTDKAYTNFKSKTSRAKSNLGFSLLAGFRKVAVVLFLPLLISVGYLYLKSNNGNKHSNVEINTNPGIVSTFNLPDGSKVWLNAGSSLKYTSNEDAGKRTVELTGEGYFEVVRNPQKPFIVKAGPDYYIEVLGTSFNVSAYTDDELIETTLIKGSVKLNIGSENGSGIPLFLKPDQKAGYNKKDQSVYVADIKTNADIDWKNGELIFRQDPMDKVLKKLSRRYNVRFDVKDTDVYKAIITARFKDETIPQVMEYLSVASGIKYSIQKTTINGDDLLNKPVIEIKK
jgi:ferric-dicitrate binding protein FerR (iron transport regulator)